MFGVQCIDIFRSTVSTMQPNIGLLGAGNSSGWHASPKVRAGRLGLTVVRCPDQSWGAELVALRHFGPGDLLAVYTGEMVEHRSASASYTVEVCVCGCVRCH